MHLLRSLVLFVAKYDVHIVGEHIPNTQNGAADALSCDNVSLFLQQVPSAHLHASPIPKLLVEASNSLTGHAQTYFIVSQERTGGINTESIPKCTEEITVSLL